MFNHDQSQPIKQNTATYEPATATELAIANHIESRIKHIKLQRNAIGCDLLY